MAIFQLKLDVDSTAHPELHQMLTMMENPSFREERVRQLASTGLIWERMRLAPPATVNEAATDIPAIAQGAPGAAHLALVSKPSKHDALGLPVLHDEVPGCQMFARPEAGLQPVAESSPLAGSPSPRALQAPTDGSSEVHMSGKRSRLMRMKNRGLFTNE